MLKIAALLLLATSLVAPPARADVDVRDFKFGILREVAPDEYRMHIETTRIPQKLKDTGFRFGLEFQNPNRDAIQWFEVVHLPAPLTEATGNTRKVAPRAIQTDKYSSSDARVVDHFWFDRGDPLGRHRLELYVNGRRRYSVEFDVVPE
jgi:hypothetical protein